MFRIVYYILIQACKFQNPKIAMFTLLTTILNVEVPSIIWDTTSQIMLQKSSTVIWKLQSSIPAMNVFASLCHVMSLSYHCRAVWPRSPAAHHHTYASKYAQCRGQHVCQGQHVSNSCGFVLSVRERGWRCASSVRAVVVVQCVVEDVFVHVRMLSAQVAMSQFVWMDWSMAWVLVRARFVWMDWSVTRVLNTHASACCLFYISLLACSYWVHDGWGFYTLCLSIYYEWPCG